MGLANSLLVVSLAAFSSAAWAIGSTQCANGDGTVRRTELEIWGANPVTWSYHGEQIANDKVKLEPSATIVVDDVTAQDPNLGEARYRTTVEEAHLTLASGETVSEFVLCKLVDYPGVLD